MERIIVLFACALLAAGLYLIAAQYARFPTHKAVRMANLLTAGGLPGGIFAPASKKLSRHLHLTDSRRRDIARRLDAAGIDVTPEYYVSRNIVYTAVLFAPAVLLLFFMPLLTLPAAAAAVYPAYLSFTKLSKKAAKHKAAIETEVPKFVSVLKESLSYNRDIYYAIRNYRDVAGKDMRREIDILLSDMATGNRKVALSRFEGRINSESISGLVRGLIGVENGENMRVYLDGLEVQLRNYEINAMRTEAKNRAKELTSANLALLGSLVFLVVVLFGTTIFRYGQNLFGAWHL